MNFYKLATLLLIGGGTLSAANFSFTGTFSTDDQVQIFSLTLSAPATLTFETLSYGGGTNSQGAAIPSGGFDPLLTWFSADGTMIGSNSGGTCGSAGAPPRSFLGACNDADVTVMLGTGSYSLALTQAGNDSLGSGFPGDLSLGFSEQGAGNFTASGPCMQFCDLLSGDMLTGNYDVEILSVASASAVSTAPEPASLALTAIGLSLFAFVTRRRRLARASRYGTPLGSGSEPEIGGLV